MPWPPRGDFDPDAARRFRGGMPAAATTPIRGGGRRPGTAGHGWAAASLPAGGPGAALMGTSLPIAIPAGMLAAAAAAARKKQGHLMAGGGEAGGGGEDGGGGGGRAASPVVHVGAATFVPPHLLDGAGTFAGSAAVRSAFSRPAAPTPADAAAAGVGGGLPPGSLPAGASPGAGGPAGGGGGLKRDRLLQRNAVLRQTGFLEGAAPQTASALPTVFDPLRPDAVAAPPAAVAAAVAGGGPAGDGPPPPPPPPAAAAAAAAAAAGLGRRRTSEVSEPVAAPARPAAAAAAAAAAGSASRGSAARASALSLALGTPPGGVGAVRGQ